MYNCPFCPIPPDATLVREWHDVNISGGVVAFQPLNPVTPGHLLIVPRQHVSDFAEDPQLSGIVMKCAAEEAGNYRSCNVITSMGLSATQTVFHLHVHIVPRFIGDGLLLPWSNQRHDWKINK